MKPHLSLPSPTKQVQTRARADPGFFVRRSRFSDVIRGGGGEKVLKIMLVIKYRLIRKA